MGGGMGDVGKFAMTLARTQTDPTVKCDFIPIALSIESSSEGSDKGFEVDVTDLEWKEKTENLLGTMDAEVIKIDIAKDSAEEEIGNAIEGAEAVITCLGNRQPSMERWCAMGTQKVIGAMKTKKIERLVSLSSFGIGEDFVKTSAITILWKTMLRTMLRSARKDLQGLEKAVSESQLDYLLVRPVGLDPSVSPKGSYNQLVSWDYDGKVDLGLSKSDAALFMLREAL